MKKEWILVPVTCLSLVACGLADAQTMNRMRVPTKAPRIDLGSRVSTPSLTSRSSSAVRRAPSIPRPSSGHSNGLNHGRSTGSFPLGAGNYGDNPFGGLLGQYLYNEYGRGHRYDPYAGEKAQAKAYRDAAIANAVVNVVGILATANQPRVQAVCPTTTVVAAPAGPRGHVERQRILVQEGRIEEYQVWIPEHRIPETGEVVVGHHETRRREIAPVYEDRDVWVPGP